jgi:hypothetical protein
MSLESISDTRSVFLGESMIPKFTPVKADLVVDYCTPNSYRRILISVDEGLCVNFPLTSADGEIDYTGVKYDIAYNNCRLEGDILMILDQRYGWVPMSQEVQSAYKDHIVDKIMIIGEE